MNRERTLLELFDLGLVLKAIDGALEVAGALMVLIVPPALVVRIVDFVTAGELAEEPNDFVATSLRSLAHAYAIHPHLLIALYLALHGAVKVLLVLGIFRGARFAYPLFIAALGIFGAYEAYRGVLTGSLWLDALAVVDLLLLLLAAHEYRVRYSSSG